ncbi:unnamed protein product, partial [Didymodactylos carnosus]
PYVFDREYYIELTKSMSVNGYHVFSSIVEKLIDYKNLNLSWDYFTSKLEQYFSQERLEQQTFRTIMDDIQLKMTSGGAGHDQRKQLDLESYLLIDDMIVEAKKFVTKVVYNWNIILQELEHVLKKYDKEKKEAAKQKTTKEKEKKEEEETLQ